MIIKILIGILLSFTPLLFPKDLTEIEYTEPEQKTLVEDIKTPEEEILEEMSIEEKVGQLFIFGFEGTTLTDTNREIIEDLHIGGVLLLSRNIVNESQLKKLNNQIQEESKIPLFISIDQEGGVVARIRWDDRLTKAQKYILNKEEAYTVAKNRGALLKTYGINMNLAPVAEYITDSNSFMYDRVFRGNEQEVVNKVVSSVNGYTDSGIISVIKHFPGHSDSSPDSHYYLPIVNIKNSQWDSYVEPFSKTLESTQIDALMVGHIKYPNIDSNPSTISKEIITNRLINDLNYDGLIISDDMEMDALADIDDYTKIAKKALEAGNDILIYSRYTNKYPHIREDVYNYIVSEVKNGNMDIDDKVLKILKFKIEYGILEVNN
jgi:beta-N-acetylhexosaminidase